jgi:hypothetical protein
LVLENVAGGGFRVQIEIPFHISEEIENTVHDSASHTHADR